MSFKSLALSVLVSGLFFLNSCKTDAVNLDYTNAKGEVPQLGNLVFRFNKSLVKDSLLNAWDSSDYVSFEPKIQGRFRWEAPDQLVFSPSQPLAPATTYTAKIKSELLRFTKYNSVKNADKISFHTPDLTMDQSQVYWVLQDESGRVTVPQVDLYFNYKVNPADLKEKLNIEIEGKKMDYTLLTASPDQKITLRVNSLKAEDKDYSTRISIDKGFLPEGGTNATTSPLVSTISIPSPFVLTIQNITSDHDGTEGTVHVITSQQLTDENLKSFLKFDPSLDYTVELADDGFTITSDKFDVEKSYSFTILKGLRGKIGGVLKEDVINSVAFGEMQSDIAFTNSKAVYLSKNGAKNLEIRITNTPNVKIIISKIYENNLLMAQRYGYSPKENSGGYASYNDQGDGDEGYYDDYGSDAQLGDVIYEKEIDTRSLPKSNGGRILNFSQFEDRLPDFKGIYHVEVRSTKDYWVKDSR
ncbi:MAG: hypothetical protein JSU05_10140, partial [Bacteroidetes bacterium]|nr:hypothetical protein [Bacteroidota bacterium]